MTHPAFLLLTVVACVLGTSTKAACGCGLDLPLALAATGLAVLAHAAGNVLNDPHDARSDADWLVACPAGGLGLDREAGHYGAGNGLGPIRHHRCG
jgi:hypothetical protein